MESIVALFTMVGREMSQVFIFSKGFRIQIGANTQGLEHRIGFGYYIRLLIVSIFGVFMVDPTPLPPFQTLLQKHPHKVFFGNLHLYNLITLSTPQPRNYMFEPPRLLVLVMLSKEGAEFSSCTVQKSSGKVW